MANVQYYNLTGGLNTIQGIGTINQGINKTESPDMQNVEFYELGGLKSMEGNIRIGQQFVDDNGKPLRITLGYEYILYNDKYLIVTTEDGQVWEYNKPKDTFNKLIKFPSATQRHSICAFNFGIVISNGIDPFIFYSKGRHQAITGTVQTVEGSDVITGTDTKFLNQVHVGDYVYIGTDENTYIVKEVTSDTELKLNATYPELKADQMLYLGEFSIVDATYQADYNEEEQTYAIERKVRGLAINSYNGRIFVGADDGVLYYSEVGLYNGWSNQYGAGAIPQFYNDNSDFTAIAIWDKYLVLFKRERCYLLNGNSADDSQWVIEPFSDYTCESQQSWIDSANGVYIYSRKAGGIYPVLSRTIYNANYQGTELSLKIRNSFRLLSDSKYEYIFPVYHPKKKYLMFYMQKLTDNGSQSCFIYDLTAKSWLYRKVTQEVTIAFRFDNEIYIGTQDGKILQEFQGTTFDGTAIDWYWKSPFFAFGRGTDYKSTREIRLKLSEEGGNNFKLFNYRDGDIVKYGQRKIKLTNSHTGLIWDLGYNQNEVNPEYGQKDAVYEVKSSEEETLYWVDNKPEMATTVPLNTRLYSDSALTEFAGLVGLVYKKEYVDNQSEDTVNEAIPHEVYQYSGHHFQYLGYSTTDGYYIWVPFDNGEPQEGKTCKINIGGEVTKTLSRAAFRVTDSRYKGNNPLYVAVNQQPTYWNKRPVCYYWSALNADGSANNAGSAAPNTFVSNSAAYQNIFALWVGTLIFNGTYLWLNATRDSSADIYSVTGTEQPSGNDPNLATTMAITKIDKVSDTQWDLTLSNDKTYTINPKVFWQAGNQIPVYMYSTKEDLQALDNVYSDKECTKLYGTVGKDDTQTFVTTTEGHHTVYQVQYLKTEISYTYRYYKEIPLEFTYTGNTKLIPNKYDTIQLPTEFPFENLTNTVWSGDDYNGASWVTVSHQTKRFPIANQYFSTMQLEFRGTEATEAMTLYGFEIDGIELEEVPYR